MKTILLVIIGCALAAQVQAQRYDEGAFFRSLERARQQERQDSQIRRQQFEIEEMQRSQRRFEESQRDGGFYVPRKF